MQSTVSVDGASARVAGIRGVKTHPDHRGKGLATAAMTCAGDFIARELQPDFSLLWVSKMAVPLYETLGRKVFDGAVYCEQPKGTVLCSELLPESSVMVLLPGAFEGNMESIHLRGAVVILARTRSSGRDELLDFV